MMLSGGTEVLGNPDDCLGGCISSSVEAQKDPCAQLTQYEDQEGACNISATSDPTFTASIKVIGKQNVSKMLRKMTVPRKTAFMQHFGGPGNGDQLHGR